LLRKKQAANGYSFAVLAPYSRQGKDGKGMERKREIEYNDLLPKKGNPLNEIVTYKVGGTLYVTAMFFDDITSFRDMVYEQRFEKMEKDMKRRKKALEQARKRIAELDRIFKRIYE